MTIRTPADLVAYLVAVARSHPKVNHVITGDDIRVEESKLSKAEYPCVDIETPTHRIPFSESPATLATRIFVYNLNPGGKAEDHDVNQDISHGIALSIIACIKMHTEDEDYGIILAEDFVIEPRMHYSSDGVSGWVFQVVVQVDQSLCKTAAIDPASIVFPQFSWENDIDEDAPLDSDIQLINTSIAPDDATHKFYWQEKFRGEHPHEVGHGDQISFQQPELFLPGEDTLTHRIFNVWIQLTVGEKIYYAYAEIDTRMTSGWSVPFVPEIPIIE